ncbi:MAG: family 2 glycosyl transferase [Rhodospirillaceae bacterium]|nr:MAG: family 2 glycosyl transferase [Rhodospirillaceae bacterium]
MAVACGRFLAFIDSDCRPEKDWLERGLARLAQAEVIGGRVEVVVEDVHAMRPVEAFEKVFAFPNKAYVQRKGFSITANLLMRRAVYDTVGGFRSGVSEDLEWCQRARAQGYPVVYADDVVVLHPARRDFSELLRRWKRLTREAYLLTLERRFGRVRWALRSWVVLLSPFGHLFQVLVSPKLERTRDKLAAIGVLFAIRAVRFVEAHRLLVRRE